MALKLETRTASLILVIVVSAVVNVQLQSSTYYVRSGATGANNGSDWANAYTNLPATLQRGATYYIADGSYGSRFFDTAASGTTRITIKKATAADHGTQTGWASAYGDGQAQFTYWDFETDYWVLDGNRSTGTYGFSVQGGCTGGRKCIDVGGGTGPTVDDVTIRSTTVNPGGNCAARGVYVTGADDLMLENVEIWNADNDAFSMTSGTNVILDHLYVHTRNNAGCGTHGDAFELWGGGNNTIRHSRVAWDGQQVFWGGNFTHGRWDIYGNRFFGGATSGKGLHPHSSDPLIGPVYVYNNTFSNLNISMDLKSNTSGNMRNNIFINTSNPGFGGASHDYNWYENGMSGSGEPNAQFGSNPFVSGSFQLAAPTGPGATLSAPYNVDPQGVTRGGDGFWDVGALECSSCSGSAQSPPAPPTNLRVVSG